MHVPSTNWIVPAFLPIHWDWDVVFGDSRGPVEVELGCGRATYALEAARRAPDRRFLAIDYAGKYLAKGDVLLLRSGLKNVRLYYGAHEPLLIEWPAESINVVHLYFPDPWHKDRHAKRRSARTPILACLHHALELGGELRLRTDVPSYFEEMLAALQEMSAGFEIVDGPFTYDAPPTPEWIPTFYESKFLEQGLTCHAVTARKRSSLP